MALTRIGSNNIKDSGIEKVDLNSRVIDVSKLDVEQWGEGQILSIGVGGNLEFIDRSEAGETSLGDLSDVTVIGASDGQSLVFRGISWVNENVDYNALANVPLSFVPVEHTHDESDIDGLDKYTQSEIDTLLSQKSDISHLHVMADITDSTWISDVSGSSVGDLIDINLTTPATEGQVLGWSDADGAFIPVDVVSGGGAVDSVFTRTGDIVAESGDYAAFYADIVHTHVKADITDFSDADYAAVLHTHVKADITDFDEADYAAVLHTHVKADITDFSDADYATAVHTHVKADITDFSDADYATAVHTHVKADITDFVEADYATAVHTHVKADISDFNDADYATVVHVHVEADITDLDKYTKQEVDDAISAIGGGGVDETADYNWTGIHSFSVGIPPVGQENVTIGLGLTMEGDGREAVTIGRDAQGVNFGTVIGYNITRNGGESVVAIGRGATYEDKCVSVGYQARTEDVRAVAVGYNSTAFGQYAVALGSVSNSRGESSIALGYNTVIEGDWSVGLGAKTTIPTGGTSAIAIGTKATVTQAGEIAIEATNDDFTDNVTQGGKLRYDPSTSTWNLTNTSGDAQLTLNGVGVSNILSALDVMEVGTFNEGYTGDITVKKQQTSGTVYIEIEGSGEGVAHIGDIPFDCAPNVIVGIWLMDTFGTMHAAQVNKVGQIILSEPLTRMTTFSGVGIWRYRIDDNLPS